MEIVALVGSVRTDSYNNQIAEFMKTRYKDKLKIELLEIRHLPYFDQDEEEDPPASVKDFKHKIKNSDGVLIVTPEYNHSVPGMLKNALDWVSRVDKVMTGKPVFIAGASMGQLGTVRCQMHLRQILAAPGVAAKVLPGNEVLIGMVQNKLDAKGNIVDEPTVAFLDSVVDQYLAFSSENKV